MLSKSKKKDPKVRLLLGSWNYPLRGHPLRYVLEITNTSYYEKLYSQGPLNGWDSEDKITLSLPLPGIPYLIHNDVKLSGSQVILEYILDLTKADSLRGANKASKYLINNIRFMADELLSRIFCLRHFDSNEAHQDIINTEILPKFTLLANDLGMKRLFYDDKLSVADIYVYCCLMMFRKSTPNEFSKIHSQFAAFITHFESIPSIDKYHQTPRYPKD